MIAILLFAAVFGGALVVVLARYGPPILGRGRPGSAADRRSAMPLSVLRSLTVELLNELGLVVVEPPESDERFVVATRPEPLGQSRYLVLLAPDPRGGVVDQAAVVGLAEAVKGERATVGILITPGEIERAGLAGLDVALELIDGARLRHLIAHHLPHRLGLLAQYRGCEPSTADKPAAHELSVAGLPAAIKAMP